MDKKEILAFISKNPVAYMATAEGNTPHVRAMGTYKADENGILFSMQTPKDVYKQLKKNPATELAYFADGVQIRVTGQMEEIKDQSIKEEVVKARPFYKPGVDENGWDYVGVFKVKNARATILDMKGPPSPVGEPKVWIDL